MSVSEARDMRVDVPGRKDVNFHPYKLPPLQAEKSCYRIEGEPSNGLPPAIVVEEIEAPFARDVEAEEGIDEQSEATKRKLTRCILIGLTILITALLIYLSRGFQANLTSDATIRKLKDMNYLSSGHPDAGITG